MFGRTRLVAIPQPPLDQRQLADEFQRRPGMLVRCGCLAGLVELALRMGHATGVGQLQGLGDAFIGLPTVGDERAMKAVKQAQGHCAAARGVVIEQHDPPSGCSCGSHAHPVIGGGCLVALQDLQRRLVAVNDRLGEPIIVQQVDQRHQECAAEPDRPNRHPAAAERDTHPLKLPLLAVQGYPIDEPGRNDVRQKRRRGDSLGEDRRRHGGDIGTPAAARAGVLRPGMLKDLDLGRDELELLGSLLADALERGTVVRADRLGVGQVVQHLVPGQLG